MYCKKTTPERKNLSDKKRNMNFRTVPIFTNIFLILNFFALAASAQHTPDDYAANWQRVKKYEEKRLPTSALKEVDQIYRLAKKDKNEPQVIKSLLYKNLIYQSISEDATRNMIDTIELEITTSPEPAKSVLQSITAQLYENYVAYNRYRLYSISNTDEFKKEDIATWSLDDFRNKIASLYEASIQNPKLRDILLDPFDAMLEKGNARYLRPTLFDFLAHRALNYFKSNDLDVNRPSYNFEINDPEAFAPAARFVNAAFETRDTSSLHLKALKTYQELIQFHMNDVKPLVAVDLERLEFVNQYAIMPDKQQLYIAALKNIFSTYKDESVAEAGYKWAQAVKNITTGTDKKKEADNIKEVMNILNQVITKYPDSRGAKQAFNLLEQMKHPALSLTTEKVNVANTPFRALVSFTNLHTVYLRVIPVTKAQKEQIRNSDSQEEEFKKITALHFVKEWKQDLPNINDYLNHQAEIKIEGLKPGEYILLASTQKDFRTGKNSMSANFLFVSDISFINNGKHYFVLNRSTGQPMANALVKVMLRNYNYKTRKYNPVNVATLRSDKNGYFAIPDSLPNNAYNMQLDISTPNDRLYLDDIQRTYSYNPYQDLSEYTTQKEMDENTATVFFFSDRSIYRPSQTIYFKGIGITKDLVTNKWKLLRQDSSITVYLYNANGQKIDSLQPAFNEYGSFNGKFTLPENQLTGSFRISSEEYPRRNLYFSVEEYKRPRFFAEFEKAKETYRINDTVSITGKAEAYAGSRIDGAQVTYRVVREARFLYPWYFWRKGFPRISPLEIVHGETVTDENGQFNIRFKAIPDASLDPSTDPVFDYRITADITDINGETRSTDILIPIGYKALNLQLSIANKATFLAQELSQISVSATNLSGQPQKVRAAVSIYQLKSPNRTIRERLWNTPDTTVMSREEFLRYFPHDEYRDESNPEVWEKLSLVQQTKDTINGSSKIQLQKKLNTGWYMAQAESEDRYGNKVQDVRYFRVLQPEDKKVNLPDYLIAASENKNLEPGQTANTYIASASDVFLIQIKDTIKTTSSEAKPEFNFYRLKNSLQTTSLPITESDRGGFGVLSFFVKDNRFFSTKFTVDVPRDNKKLDITFDTYREKTLPGSRETWNVKIAGYKGEKLAAEMLASMYDQSLDQFMPHSWAPMNIWPVYSSFNNWQGDQNFSFINSFDFSFNPPSKEIKNQTFDQFVYLEKYRWNTYMKRNVALAATSDMRVSGGISEEAMVAQKEAAPLGVAEEDGLAKDSVFSSPNAQSTQPGVSETEANPIRTNFNETAFFYPELKTDKDGNITFSFTMPEALTKWRLMTLAHTKDLATGYAETSVVTQKDLMVIPNAPRFLREGDQMQFSAKVVNMTDKEIPATVEFHLLNADTKLPVDSWFKNNDTKQSIMVPANQSRPVSFSIDIPKGFNDLVVYRIVASAENISDGEEAYLPVLTNRMLVTESMPLEMNGTGTKNFSFEKLLKSGQSKTLTNYGLTVEYAPNPAWYAVQALPYLNEYPYECTEQVFNRYFANALAMQIANSSPKLQAIFEKWKTTDTAALLSNLQKNQELKSVLLEETPWVMQAKSEEQQKKNIALLFDLNNMAGQLDKSLKTVSDRQSANGGFVWFKNGPDDRFMTQYIVSDIGHLKKLNAWPQKNKNDLQAIIKKALPYLDNRINEDYQNLKKSKIKLDNDNLSVIAIHYLYARSFFPEIAVQSSANEAYQYYLGQAKKFWTKQSIYMQGLIALAAYRTGDNRTANAIIASLKETAIHDQNLGMYWKDWTRRSWWWYQAPIESQALMIEVFSEVAKDDNTVDQLKKWLLKNKQTNNWKTTKATAEAVYALLLQGSHWLSDEKEVRIQLGKTVLSSRDEKQQEGTGYFQRKIDGARVTPDMGKISVSVTDNQPKTKTNALSWGAVYWQYFEDLDKITFAETPLQLSKKLFVEKNTDRGPVLTPVNDGDQLHIGDKIKVRIELRVDRDMEYVHMKDMRASAMEPVNVLSQFKWQAGLGYYESTKDASTNFFFNYLPKGTYVFEYPMFVTHAGDFSNGITSIQCMYAPEFTAHSEGVRIKVVKP